MSEENAQIISEENVEPVEEKCGEESTQKKKDPRRVELGKKLTEWNQK